MANDFQIKITVKADELAAAITKLAEVIDRQQASVITAEHIELQEKPAEKQQIVHISEQSVTLEEIRAVLSDKLKLGKKTEVKALFAKYGSEKLTDIDPANFPQMFKEIEVM